MFNVKKTVILGVALAFTSGLYAQKAEEVDVCIYGGTSAGIIAAYTAKKLNKKVLLVVAGRHLGGLTTGGLGFTDIGNKYAISGLSLDFYRRIGKHYGRLEQWIFEPGVASAVFQQYIKSAGFPILYQYEVTKADKQQGVIKSITLQHEAGTQPAKTIRAKMFIDCSYEGDLMALAGVSYFVGREANSAYNETYNGVQLREHHQFPDGIDPYKVPGKPESGLLWGISNEQPAAQGSGDQKVQAYNFRICLTSNPANRIDITRPDNYDSTRYELLLRYLAKKQVGDLWGFLKFDLMPNQKTDINNNGPFSTDMIGMNYTYPDADYATRKLMVKTHEDYTKGFLYFIGHDARMPEHLRTQMLKWGYPKDEYTSNGHWSPQLYIREARRMKGAYVMTQANCEGKEVVTDAIGMAAYTMDSHNCTRLVVNGMVKNEGDVQIGGFGPYPIAYRSLIPQAQECTNLLVPVCLSATHIAYGSIRMEPVFMALAQSSAVAAVQAINKGTTIQDVDVKQLQQELKNNPLADGSTPDLLVDNDDSSRVTVKGDWKKDWKGAYGPSAYQHQAGEGGEASVRFTPLVTKAGAYRLYVYLPKLKDMSPSFPVIIHNGSASKQTSIEPAKVRVEGQTGGEWVDLGVHQLVKGSKAYVEIAAGTGKGLVVADAVLLVAQK